MEGIIQVTEVLCLLLFVLCPPVTSKNGFQVSINEENRRHQLERSTNIFRFGPSCVSRFQLLRPVTKGTGK